MANAAAMTEEDVCAHIRDSVLERRLAPGTKLTEESLCAIFGVGRTTIRRAFLLLKRDNIVELQRNRGAMIASPSPEEAQQVFESRRLVEKALLEQSISKINATSLEALEDHLEEEQSALASGNIARWIRLTGEFHVHLARQAGNEIMSAFLEQLVFQTSLIVALYGPSNSGSNCNGDDHRAIVQALKSQDLDSASNLLVRHLQEIESQLTFDSLHEADDLQAAFANVRTA